MGKKEYPIEKYLADSIERIGGICVKMNVYGYRGFPDRLCVLPIGIIIFVECKAPGKKPSGPQSRCIRKLSTLGHFATIVDNKYAVDGLIETAKAWMKSKDARL